MEVTASLASTVLSTVLGNFKDVIKSEIALQQGLQADLAFIKEELEMMQAFLTASDEGRGRDEVVNVWVKHVSKLAYDVEYCLSRFGVRLERSFLARHLCMLPARHDVGKEIRELKARVEDVSKRSKRYRLLDDNSPSAAASFRIDDNSQSMVTAGEHLLRQLIRIKEAYDHQDAGGDDGLQVIAAWSASEDAGKTSFIIKEAYDHQDICDSFQYRAWIKLRSPFHEEEFIKCMVTQFIANSHQAHEEDVMKKMPLEQQLEKYVSDGRYLIVIDGISTIMEWHLLRTYLPDKNNRSRIVVSTQQAEVATLCVGRPYKVLEANHLSSKGSIHLVFKEDNQWIGSCSSHISVETVYRWNASVSGKEAEALEGSSAGASRPRSTRTRGVDAGFYHGQTVAEPADFGRPRTAGSRAEAQAELAAVQREPNVLNGYGLTGLLADESRAPPYGQMPPPYRPYGQMPPPFHHYGQMPPPFRPYGQMPPPFHHYGQMPPPYRPYGQMPPPYGQMPPPFHHYGQMPPPYGQMPPPYPPYGQMLPPNGQMLGRENEKRVLRDLIIDKPFPYQGGSTVDERHSPVHTFSTQEGLPLRVISVWGPRGIGKTALVESMSSELRRHFLVLPMTVKRPFSRQEFFQSLIALLGRERVQGKSATSGIEELSSFPSSFMAVKRPLSYREYFRSLIDSLGRERIEGKSTKSGIEELKTGLSSLLCEQRYLLVLDDLSCTREWNLIVKALPDRNNGSCILVTTRKEDVAIHCSRLKEQRFMLGAPDIQEALGIFYNKVYKNAANVQQPPELDEEAKYIVERCGRIPYSVATIGAFLSTRPKTTAEWRKCIDRLDDYAVALLVCRYHSLSFRLRICLLYLSIFPKDKNIRGGRLVRRWIAEGYAIAREMPPTATALAVGKDYIAELLRKELIQRSTKPTERGQRVEFYHVNPQIHKMALSKSMEENLVFVLDDSCSLTTKRTVRHLAVCKEWTRAKNEWVSAVDISRLQSLTISGKWESFFISDSMRLLGVLDLEGVSEVTNKDIQQIGKLIHLKYLSLRGCESISRLPDSLGHLTHLQTLDIRDTSVTAMPRATVKLQALQHLRAGKLPSPTCGRTSVKIPAGIAGLMALQTLGTISFEGAYRAAATRRNLCAGEENILEELKELTKLRKLGVVGITPSNCKQLGAVATLRRLESLSLHAGVEGLRGCLDDLRLTLPNLERLKLHGALERLPDFVGQLVGLQKLTLSSTQLRHTSISDLGSLRNLSTLCLMERSYMDRELHFEDIFPSLTMLQLTRLEVEKVLFMPGTMPKLEQLYLYGVGASETSTCSGLCSLPSLKEVSVTKCGQQMGRDVQGQLLWHARAPTLDLDTEQHYYYTYHDDPSTCNIM